MQLKIKIYTESWKYSPQFITENVVYIPKEKSH